MTSSPPSAGVRVAYVVRSWPRLSQTFILNEVLALERLGLELAIFAMSHADEAIAQPQVAHVRAPVHYLDARRSRGKAVAEHVRVFLTAPARYARTLAFVLRGRDLADGYSTTSRWGCLDQAVHLAAAARRERLAGRPLAQLHAHFAHSPGLVGALTHRLTGIPFSLTAHARDLYGIPARALAARAREAEAVVTCCRANAEYLGPLVEHGRLHLVHHGVDLETFRPRPRTVEHDVPVVMSVGRLVEKKGFPDLLAACAQVREGGRLFRLAIYGDGPLRGELERLRRKLGLDDVVTFEGARSQRELVTRFQSADVFALTPFVAADGDRDGVPNVLVEAMACGVPVVTTSVGGTVDLVRDGHNGLLAAPRDVDGVARHLGALLGDPVLRRRLGAAGRTTAEDGFDAQVAARQLASLFGAIA